MAKLRISDKAERVLKLLMGLRNKQVASALAARGFTQADLEEGFKLLRGLTGVALSKLPTEPAANPSYLLELDQWENEWFPVAEATLARHYPEVRDKLFLNLSQTEGAAVIVSVSTFLNRLARMSRNDGGYGEEGKAARKLLERRGLTHEVVDTARTLIGRLQTVEDAGPVEEPGSLEEERERFAAAETALWAWYLEWGTIARSAIKDRRLLRRLGFLTTTRAKGLVDDVETGAELEEPSAPDASVVPTVPDAS